MGLLVLRQSKVLLVIFLTCISQNQADNCIIFILKERGIQSNENGTIGVRTFVAFFSRSVVSDLGEKNPLAPRVLRRLRRVIFRVTT